MTAPLISPPDWRQDGFTLIEVLVAVVVLAIGILGLASLQAISMRFNHSSVLRTQATNLAYEITDAMRANLALAKAGSYNIALGTKPSGTSLASKDLIRWKDHLVEVLPSGDGSVAVNANDFATVRIRWDSSNDPNTDDTTEFTFQTRL